MLGIVPAAGAGTRIQPLAFSKEMLPVARQTDEWGAEHPKAVSDFLIDRMLLAGADRICIVISPDKTDIIGYYARHNRQGHLFYTVQDQPRGLCDALFQAAPYVAPDEDVVIGLPDTIWFPEDGFARLPAGLFSFLLFHVEAPQLFDAVLLGAEAAIREIQVKHEHPDSHWIWGAFRLPGAIFRQLHDLWLQPGRGDEYVGTLVNAYIAQGGQAFGVDAGESYLDVGTIDGYRAAISRLLIP
jgi:dTDP-glucose pyrophosphorylase